MRFSHPSYGISYLEEISFVNNDSLCFNGFHLRSSPMKDPTMMTYNYPLTFNICHFFKSPMVPFEYLFWKSTFMDVLHLNSLIKIIESNDIPKEMANGEPNPNFTFWSAHYRLFYRWLNRNHYKFN